jgi:Tol biopolymer transport system component
METRHFRLALASVGSVVLAAAVLTAAAGAASTTRVSVSNDGAQSNGNSAFAAITPNGRFVAFRSDATNLVAGDTNAFDDIFVRDLVAGTTDRVSVSTTGSQGNAWTTSASISADGRFVAFASEASNLVDGDTNGSSDVFVHDRRAGTTTRASVSSSGAQANLESRAPVISDDGASVTFESKASNLVAGDTNVRSDVFVHELVTGTTTRVSVSGSGAEANDDSNWPAIGADGRFVAFYSRATNLVVGDTNAHWDVFVHDRQTGGTTRVSLSSAGGEGNGHSETPAISADGRFVAFRSEASNLVEGDGNGVYDAFVHDRATGTTERVSVTSSEDEATGSGLIGSGWDPTVSDDGRFVAFGSDMILAGGEPECDYEPCISMDVFVRDRQAGTTTLVTAKPDGFAAGGYAPDLTADGGLIAFDSSSSELVAGDTNGKTDVFLFDQQGTAGGGSGPLCNGAQATIVGTPGDDTLTGTAGADVIHGLDGNDAVQALGGNDTVCGGGGADSLAGDRGADRLFGGDGDDSLDGGRDKDVDACDGGAHLVGDSATRCESVVGIP